MVPVGEDFSQESYVMFFLHSMAVNELQDSNDQEVNKENIRVVLALSFLLIYFFAVLERRHPPYSEVVLFYSPFKLYKKYFTRGRRRIVLRE